MGSHLHGRATGQGTYLNDWEAAQKELRLQSQETLVWKCPARLCDLGESPHLSILAFLICGKRVRPTGLPRTLSGSKNLEFVPAVEHFLFPEETLAQAIGLRKLVDC